MVRVLRAARQPEIAGVVFASTATRSSAAPIARHVIETYFAKKAGITPYPVFTPPAVPAARAAAPPAGTAGQ